MSMFSAKAAVVPPEWPCGAVDRGSRIIMGIWSASSKSVVLHPVQTQTD